MYVLDGWSSNSSFQYYLVSFTLLLICNLNLPLASASPQIQSFSYPQPHPLSQPQPCMALLTVPPIAPKCYQWPFCIEPLVKNCLNSSRTLWNHIHLELTPSTPRLACQFQNFTESYVKGGHRFQDSNSGFRYFFT